MDVLARVGRLRAVTDAESALLAAASAVALAAAALGSGPSLLAVTAWVIGACRAQLEVVEVIIPALVADLRYAAGLFSVEAARVLHPAEAAKHAARRWHVLPGSGHRAVPVRCRPARGWAELDLARLSAGRLGA